MTATPEAEATHPPGTPEGPGAAGSVAEALGEVERWFRDEETRHQSELLEVDQEIANLKTALANLETQLESLHGYRAELGARVRTIGAEHVERAHRVLYEALFHQRARLLEREALVAAAAEARAAAVPASVANGAIGALIAEYEQFKGSVEPTLAALPESYRAVVLKHHQSVTDKLKDHFAGILGAPLQIEAEPLSAEVAYAVDAPAGEPVGIVVLLPVAEEVHGRWGERGDGLGLWIACRVVQAVYEAVTTADLQGAQVVAGGHQGLLVIELDLTGAAPVFVDQLETHLTQVLAAAPELAGAGVRIAPRRVHIDFVMPPEGDDPRGADAG